MTEVASPESSFARSVSEFLPLVNCRRPADEKEKADIYRLRHAAYVREGAIPPDAPVLFKDAADDLPNCVNLGLHVGGQLASSIRLHIASREEPRAPAMGVFADILQPMLDRGLRILDPTRFVIDGAAARLYPRLPYATVRLCSLAGLHYSIDVILATVRLEHQSFYKRLFGHQVLCEPRHYPSLTKPISLMAVNHRTIREHVTSRYPFFRSTEAERVAIFEGNGAFCGSPAAGDETKLAI